MPTPPEVIRNYQTASAAIRDRLERFARRAWASLGEYRDADIDRLVELIAPQVLAGQRTMAQLTDAYLSALSGHAAVGIDLAAVTGSRGVPIDEVYRRPGVTVWTALAAEKTPTVAIAEGLRRLLSLVATDVELAQRVQEQATLGASGQQFYRRVLTGSEHCAKCVIASTQRYRVGTLKPIHPGCDCDVATIAGDSDPGHVLNEELLEKMHELVDLQFGNNDRGARIFTDAQGRELDYRDLMVREHGEYGPTLTWRKDQFTGPDDLAA